MPKLRFPLLAAMSCIAGTALAQANPAAPPDVGPFPPQPGSDPSLFRTLPPEAYAMPATPAPAPPAARTSAAAPAPASTPPASASMPPAPASTPPAPASTPPAAASTPPAPIVVVVPDTRGQMQEQLDRAQLEAETARARMNQAPAPINGAFTGLTDERDR